MVAYLTSSPLIDESPVAEAVKIRKSPRLRRFEATPAKGKSGPPGWQNERNHWKGEVDRLNSKWRPEKLSRAPFGMIWSFVYLRSVEWQQTMGSGSKQSE